MNRGIHIQHLFASAVVFAALVLGTPVPASATFQWDLPDWLPKPVVPADNPMSAAKVNLGRWLFYDTRLSITGRHSCASCHVQARAFTDGRRIARGATGEGHPRNSPSLANVAYLPFLTWANPAMRRLEDQLLVPIFGVAPVELGMAGRERALLNILRRDQNYRRRFRAAFPDVKGDAVTLKNLAKAIAAFERTMISTNSPYDRYRHHDDTDAISPAARRGAELFFAERLGCFNCHSGIHFTDSLKHEGLPFEEYGYHNTGLYNLGGSGRYPVMNTGLHAATGRDIDMGRFKTPSLRNIAVTAPYMHDGSIETLDAVIDFYAAGGRVIGAGSRAGDGRANPNKSAYVTGFTIGAAERADLIAFLKSLTDLKFLRDPRFADPFSSSQLPETPPEPAR